MAINKVPYPTTSVPVSDDWGRMINVVQANYLTMENSRRIDFDNDDVLKGAVFQIGGAIFLADSDTTITGTASDYVKITPGTSTATASYVSSLSGVSWNDTHRGYYDVSGNLYVFDEGKALTADEITEIQSRFIQHDQAGGISLDAETEYGTERPVPARYAFRPYLWEFTEYDDIDANYWQGIEYSSFLGLFVAVGKAGTNRVATSVDGIIWTNRTAAENNSWNDIYWSENLSLFAAVSEDGTNRVMTSPDGITWTSRSAAEANEWQAVTYAPGLGLFVAVSLGGTNRVMTSPDGITWTARAAAEANSWRDVCWSEELTLLVAVSADGTNRVMTSPDGITWTARAAAEANQWMSVCYSPDLDLFAAVSFDGTNRIMTSPDGINWTARSVDTAPIFRKVIWIPEFKIFMAVASSNSHVSSTVYQLNCATSTDGITWKIRKTPPINQWQDIAFSLDLGIVVAAEASNQGVSMVSRRFI